jgi:hypothetical protein
MNDDEKASRDAAVEVMLAARRAEQLPLSSLGYTSPAFEEPVTQATYKKAQDAWSGRHIEWLKSDKVDCYNPYPIPGDETPRQASFRMVMGEIVHRVLLSKLYPDDAWLLGRLVPGDIERLTPWEKQFLSAIRISRECERKLWDAAFGIDPELRHAHERELYERHRTAANPHEAAPLVSDPERNDQWFRRLAQRRRQLGRERGR